MYINVSIQYFVSIFRVEVRVSGITDSSLPRGLDGFDRVTSRMRPETVENQSHGEGQGRHICAGALATASKKKGSRELRRNCSIYQLTSIRME
jgi:hypothetical protein